VFRYSVPLVLVSLSVCSANASTLKVTLAGLPVNSNLSTAFVDPSTGVAFSNPGNGDEFGVNYWNPFSTLPDLTPGLVVNTAGYAPDGGVTLPYQLDFTMTFPTPADGLSMIMAYVYSPFLYNPVVPGSILIQGFDSGDNLVATDSVEFTQYSNFLEQPLSLSTEGYSIQTVTISATNIFDAFGQISISVPEPASCAILVLGGGALLMRRRSPV
jgi:hypothetical protein